MERINCPISPDKTRNERKADGNRQVCFCCGKNVKGNGETSLWIHLDDSNRVIPVGMEISPNEDMGSFPIGPDCAKKLPKGYTINRY